MYAIKLFFIVLSVTCLIFASLFFLLTLSVPKSAYQGPLSDHFNGNIFFNHEPSPPKSFLDVLHWQLTRDKKPWPTSVANAPPSPVSQVTKPDEVKITFINHSTVLIQTQQCSLLTDPIWSERPSPFSWAGPKRVRKPGIAFSALSQIDIVVISHNHYDHLDLPTLIKLDKKFHPTFIVPLGNKSLLANAGIKNIIEMDWWQHHTIKDAHITFLPAKHWSARWLTDRNRTLWGSYGIEIAGKKIYFAGDSGYGSHFKIIREKWYQPDIALLPIGAYLPSWFMRNNHLNPEEAVRAHLDLQSSQSIAIHFGTFQLGDDGLNQPVEDLAAARTKHSVTAKHFVALREGEALFLHPRIMR